MLSALMLNPAPGHSAPPSIGGATLEEPAALRGVVTAVIACILGEKKDHPDVEDCTHEALSRAIEGRSRLREGDPLRPWVIGIARHVALDALRRRKKARREASVAPGGASDEVAPAWLDVLPDPSPGPEERAASLERAARVERILAKMPEDQRRALVMFHVEGLGYQEVCKRLGVPLGTVATWLARGRRLLAESVGE
jgi:RNA polymerase sigma factor (sigma-70 family)